MIEPYKTWLTLKDGNVYRENEFGDEPNWIGCIESHGIYKWFKTYGDNRTFSLSELKQLTEWVDNFKI